MPQNFRFTKEELQYIQDHYVDMPVKEIATHLQRSPKGVRSKMERLGYKLNNLERNQIRQWSEEELNFIKENYLKMSDTKMGKIFNCTPSLISRKRYELNLYKPKSLEPYVAGDGYVKQSINGEKVFLHRYIMEQSLGRKLTQEEKVHHLDGDKSNYALDNLYLCKDRTEHAYVHDSLEKVAFELYKRGIIKFNSQSGRYYL